MALSRPEAMAYLGIKHHLTFRAWCEATGMLGSPKNPLKERSPRTWTVEELERGRAIACGQSRGGARASGSGASTASPEDILNRLFPRKKRTTKSPTAG